MGENGGLWERMGWWEIQGIVGERGDYGKVGLEERRGTVGKRIVEWERLE